MTNQHTNSRSFKPIVRAALVALAMVILFGRLDGPATQLISFLGTTARDALVLLPSFILTASQALQPDAFHHDHFSLCAFEMLVFWPLLETAAKVA